MFNHGEMILIENTHSNSQTYGRTNLLDSNVEDKDKTGRRGVVWADERGSIIGSGVKGSGEEK